MKKIFQTLLLSVCCLLWARHAKAAVPATEIRGIWIHTYAPFDWEKVMPRIARAGFNCVFVRVARGVNALYPSQILPQDGWAETAGGDELQRAIVAAHRNGLEVHVWKVCFNAAAGTRSGPKVRAFYDKMNAEDRLVRDVAGVQADYLNPGDARNRDLEVQVARELIEKYDLDGYHLDYIRYPETPSYDFDYGAISRAAFEKSIGHAVENWPQDVFSGPLKGAYEDWERGNVNDVVRRVHDEIKHLKPRVQVSAAVWRSHRKYRAALKQDWIFWAKSGWLDFVVPMDYTPDDAVFRQAAREQIANAAGVLPIAIGIGNYLLKTPDDLLRQIQIARAEGSDGYCLFAYNATNIEAQLDALTQNAPLPAAPSFRAPRFQWQLFGEPKRKDDAPAYAIGARIEPNLILPDSNYDPLVKRQTLDVDWWLEALNGEWRRKLTHLKWTITATQRSLEFHHPAQLASSASLAWASFTMPAGRTQLVLRGTRTRDDEAPQPFIARGPILEGLTLEQMADLHAQSLPPHFVGADLRVAVYAGGQASAGLLQALKDAPNLNVRPIYKLWPAHLQTTQVLILPQLNDVAELTPNIIAALRSWVRQGGTILLTHDAVGFRWHPRLFPEVGQGVTLDKGRDLEIMPPLESRLMQHAYTDHVALQAAPGALVLARESPVLPDAAPVADKAAPVPVILEGRFGRGRVVMIGQLMGFAPNGTMPQAERVLLLELISR